MVFLVFCGEEFQHAEGVALYPAAMEKMNVYWQFIVGMLTNQGPMALNRIVMMLKCGGCGCFGCCRCVGSIACFAIRDVTEVASCVGMVRK
jgi:hypothetical protein